MNVLYYALPCFIGSGEVFNYCINQLEILSKNNNIDIKIVKENITLKNQYPEFYLASVTSPIHNLDINNSNSKWVKNNNIEIYHCLHNGFSIKSPTDTKVVSTIYTTLPLTSPEIVDKDYYKMYIEKLQYTLKLSHSIIVPFTFMKDELSNFFSFNNENIHVIPPAIPLDLTLKSKVLSKAYVQSKFNIYSNYYIFIGEINKRNTLIDTINILNNHSQRNDVKLVLSITYLPKNKFLYKELLLYIDRRNLTSKIIFTTDLTYEDKINLINSSKCFINLNYYNEINITSLYAMFLNVKILTYPSKSNFEYLENYPTYITDYVDGYEVDLFIGENQNYENVDEGLDKDEIYEIASKFKEINISEMLLDVYNNTINLREEK
ncbi:MAG: glycosyltransferase [Clostridium sp.]